MNVRNPLHPLTTTRIRFCALFLKKRMDANNTPTPKAPSPETPPMQLVSSLIESTLPALMRGNPALRGEALGRAAADMIFAALIAAVAGSPSPGEADKM